MGFFDKLKGDPLNAVRLSMIEFKETSPGAAISNSSTIMEEENKVMDIVEIFLEKYQKLLNSVFKTAFVTNPETFRLSNKQNLKIIHYHLNNEIMTRNWNNVVILFEKDSNLKYEFYDFTKKNYYENFSDFKHDHIFIEKLLEKELEIYSQDIIFQNEIETYILSSHQGTETYKASLEKVFSKSFLESMKSLLRIEGEKYQTHINHSSGYYAKNAARYSYSLLDLSPILEKVNDDDFEYQMDQAIAAYDNSLYLASCATLGVCLETLCKILLMNNGVIVKDRDGTMLNALSSKLREKNLISYKFSSRIDVCYKVRNLASHTSPGKVVQNDCHFILNTIHEIVDVYF